MFQSVSLPANISLFGMQDDFGVSEDVLKARHDGRRLKSSSFVPKASSVPLQRSIRSYAAESDSDGVVVVSESESDSDEGDGGGDDAEEELLMRNLRRQAEESRQHRALLDATLICTEPLRSPSPFFPLNVSQLIDTTELERTLSTSAQLLPSLANSISRSQTQSSAIHLHSPLRAFPSAAQHAKASMPSAAPTSPPGRRRPKSV